MAALNAEWRAWLQRNLANGCDHRELLEAMMNGNIDALEAARALAAAASSQAPTPRQICGDAAFLPSRLTNATSVDLGDVTTRLLLRVKRPDLALYENVLSDDECDTLIELSRDKLQRSKVVDRHSGEFKVNSGRTSSGATFKRGELALIANIEARIARLTNQAVEYGEGLQILRYKAGGEYAAHFDYFPQTEVGSAMQLTRGGQRTATLVMYLNNVIEGGGTEFPELGLNILPRKGCAVYFAYTGDNDAVDPWSLHAGMPVLQGEKWIATKWLRQRHYTSPTASAA